LSRVRAIRHSIWERLDTAGMSERRELVFSGLAWSVVVLMSAGWLIAILDVYYGPREVYREAREAAAAGGVFPAPVAHGVGGALLDHVGTTTPFLDEASLEFLDPLRGRSGELKVVFRSPGEVVTAGGRGLQPRFVRRDGTPIASPDLRAPADPGDYQLEFQRGETQKRIRDLSVITMVPFSRKERGRIGTYMLGSWPYETGGQPRSQAYAPPVGFIQVTRENRDLPVSKHFKLGDFLTKDQPNVWPKYLLLDARMIDKIELTIIELQAMGVDVQHVQIMSGFRTPRYNHSGGNTEGRSSISRHMYGDAADFFVDNDRNGWMDDINGDGRVDIRDAEMIAEAAARVEQKYPDLVGGIGIYKTCCGHGPFTHVDVRGTRARWRY
jgi:hypothetical protein